MYAPYWCRQIFYCMSAFQAPYKAVLVSLYEFAVQSDNEKLGIIIKESFDFQFEDMPERFQVLGLDDSLVQPSYVINTSSLHNKIRRSKKANPELSYHGDNEEFLTNIMKEITMITTNGQSLVKCYPLEE